MPGGDRTGPAGAGPLTGWGRGLCRGSREPEPGTAPFGALGRGRGWRHRFWAAGSPGWVRGGRGRGLGQPRPITPQDERTALQREANALESDLARIRARLDELATDNDR